MVVREHAAMSTRRGRSGPAPRLRLSVLMLTALARQRTSTGEGSGRFCDGLRHVRVWRIRVLSVSGSRSVDFFDVAYFGCVFRGFSGRDAP